MIHAANRVPGQMLPVGAPYRGNAGAPFSAQVAQAGLGEVIPPFTPWGFLSRGLLGYIAGRAMAKDASERNSLGLAGFLTVGFLGPIGIAAQGAYVIYSKEPELVGRAKDLHRSITSKK